MDVTKKEIDAIGELFNIGTGSSATALSTILSKVVKISVPEVQVVTPRELDISYLEPAYGISVDYTKGLRGTNSLILKKQDILKLVSQMTYMDITEIDEISKSAICELMNQMMGSSSTALAGFLNKEIDISTPKLGEIQDTTSYKNFMYGQYESVMTVTFILEVEDFLSTKFVTVMSSDICEAILEEMRKMHPIT
ncbi:MAG: chemotaxis protein CheC [Aminipila sp.]